MDGFGWVGWQGGRDRREYICAYMDFLGGVVFWALRRFGLVQGRRGVGGDVVAGAGESNIYFMGDRVLCL